MNENVQVNNINIDNLTKYMIKFVKITPSITMSGEKILSENK